MNNYDGIPSETFWLLGQNKFNNSKEFYEANKVNIKRFALQPMQQIAQIIAEDMTKIDDKMNLIPTKMVSRIRRDTRFSRDKGLYRENIWIMFMRPKAEWPTYPCFWFEIQPQGYSYGVSCFETTPRFMELYRKILLERQDEFLTAVKRAESAGAIFYSDNYKKEKNSDVPEKLKKYYNVKSMYFMVKASNLSVLGSDKIITELKAAYTELAPMYQFLKFVADEYILLG
ncbi:MAG: DUF2461 domain-containing protein [Eubacteriales bacterium]